jgi:hypothetical protein
MRIFSVAFGLMTIKSWNMEFCTETEHEFYIVFEILVKVVSNKYGGG